MMRVLHGAVGDQIAACAVFLLMLMAYNANGREIGSYDTKPTQLAARELLLRGTLALNHVVGVTPEYANRWGIILGRDGRYRSIYSPVSALFAAGLTWPFWKAGLVDITAPLAPQLMAKITASVLVSLAVTFGYVTARQWISRGRGFVLALGLGLGTGLWSSASQTLWQTETAVLGFAVAIHAFVATRQDTMRSAIVIGVGLALAGAARPQLAIAIAVILVGTGFARGLNHLAVAGTIVTAGALLIVSTNWRWFGYPLGALPLLAGVNSQVHAIGSSFKVSLEGLGGLLVSPSRGLFVFSPVVLLATGGIRRAIAEGWRSPLSWCALAVAAQFAVYGSYAVWWGGHTYGPRYLLDVLPLTVPLVAVAMGAPRLSRTWLVFAWAALTWSMITAATGAFCYPNDAWNSEPVDVDVHHARLWSLLDSRIPRCWRMGPSPQNLGLFSRAALHRASN